MALRVWHVGCRKHNLFLAEFIDLSVLFFWGGGGGGEGGNDTEVDLMIIFELVPGVMIKAELVLGLMIEAVLVFGLLIKAESVLGFESWEEEMGGGEVLEGPYRDRMTIWAWLGNMKNLRL